MNNTIRQKDNPGDIKVCLHVELTCPELRYCPKRISDSFKASAKRCNALLTGQVKSIK